MSKGWKIVGTVVLILTLLGAISIGVGFMTGGNLSDIYATLNARYNLSGYWEAYSQWAVSAFDNIMQGLRQLW